MVEDQLQNTWFWWDEYGAELTTLLCTLELVFIPLPSTRGTVPARKRQATEEVRVQAHLGEGMMNTESPHPKRARVGSAENTDQRHPQPPMPPQRVVYPTVAPYSGYHPNATYHHHDRVGGPSLLTRAFVESQPAQVPAIVPYSSQVQVGYSPISLNPYSLRPAAFTHQPPLTYPPPSVRVPEQYVTPSETNQELARKQAGSHTYHTNGR